MLLLIKNHITLQVYYTRNEVQVTPLPSEQESNHMLHTFARGEELLAQLFLTHTKAWNPKVQLRAYFLNRGWQVREVEGSPT